MSTFSWIEEALRNRLLVDYTGSMMRGLPEDANGGGLFWQRHARQATLPVLGVMNNVTGGITPMFTKNTLLAALAATGLAFSASGAQAEFPEKDITMVVPWSAGGGTDTVARTLVKNAKKYLGVNINVVNKTGAMGATGMGATARARPDGYTIGMLTFQLSTYRLMGLTDLSYRNYDLIQLVNRSPAAISVRADSEFKTLADLFEYAKENPGVLTAGHSGAGGTWHLALASAAAKQNVKFNFVPFDGSAPVRTALLGGHISIATSGMSEMLQLYQDKQVRLLAIGSDKTYDLFKDVPAITNTGIDVGTPIFDWRALAAPKGVPADRMAILVEGLKKCWEDPEFQQKAKELGLPLEYKDPAGVESFLSDMELTLEPALDSVGLLNPLK
ncbi:tripartite tricarboxylate transporter substrate binding protein [Cohaesibacter celericrescens]|uniref:tripartite tricarboxylate transporter substrate binding protein n=1 Tax=Cohaesibacter celericrescens TaxID=2067669 RepID=UPI00356A1051